jgi:hypothetical protein
VTALADRFEQLVRQVIGPLVLGGPLTLVRPVGAKLALTLGRGQAIVDQDLRSRIALVRVRRARLLAPVDFLPEIGEDEVALACAFNDLLQLTNPALQGALSHDRVPRLLESVLALSERVPPPSTVAAALARHATFSRALHVLRTDTRVSWWTGKAAFCGVAPPPRLLVWPGLRRVYVEQDRVGLDAMAVGADGLTQEAFMDALGQWLTRSPLTDLALAARREPRFVWSAATLSLVASAPGLALARRALAREPADLVVAALSRATETLHEARPRALAAALLHDLRAGAGLDRVADQRHDC